MDEVTGGAPSRLNRSEADNMDEVAVFEPLRAHRIDEQTLFEADAAAELQSHLTHEATRLEQLLEAENFDEDSTLGLLTRGPGMQLLGMLGQLSAHLGSGSRFSHAVDALHRDVLELRTGGGPNFEESSPLRVEPAEGSTLRHSSVIASMSSLLRLLDCDVGAPRVVVSEPPSTATSTSPTTASLPASLQAIRDLPEFEWDSVRSHGGSDDATSSCAICLELLSATVLQMPCSSRHMFHKPCLLTWFESQSSCPVCRSKLPMNADLSSLGGSDLVEASQPPN